LLSEDAFQVLKYEIEGDFRHGGFLSVTRAPDTAWPA